MDSNISFSVFFVFCFFVCVFFFFFFFFYQNNNIMGDGFPPTFVIGETETLMWLYILYTDKQKHLLGSHILKFAHLRTLPCFLPFIHLEPDRDFPTASCPHKSEIIRLTNP